MGKLHRFHRDVFFPDWWEESINNFATKLVGKQLVCSYHATKKYDKLPREYQKVVRDLLTTIEIQSLDKEYIFEFRANENNEAKKVCYRFPTDDSLMSDIIFVISSTGKVVTIFLNKNFDPHISLDRSLYIQGEN